MFSLLLNLPVPFGFVTLVLGSLFLIITRDLDLVFVWIFSMMFIYLLILYPLWEVQVLLLIKDLLGFGELVTRSGVSLSFVRDPSGVEGLGFSGPVAIVPTPLGLRLVRVEDGVSKTEWFFATEESLERLRRMIKGVPGPS